MVLIENPKIKKIVKQKINFSKPLLVLLNEKAEETDSERAFPLVWNVISITRRIANTISIIFKT